jgi:hypothetical protein
MAESVRPVFLGHRLLVNHKHHVPGLSRDLAWDFNKTQRRRSGEGPVAVSVALTSRGISLARSTGSRNNSSFSRAPYFPLQIEFSEQVQ